MKKIYYSIITLLLLCFFSLQAQTTEGKEFWLTFCRIVVNPINLPGFDFQIRIVAGPHPTTGTIYFTNLNNDSITFNIGSNEVYDYALNIDQRQAVYNYDMGISDRSVHITSNEQVAVYILSCRYYVCDATNILPVTELGTEYYQISYTAPPVGMVDTYAVIATQNNTILYHNGDSIATLNAGEVYYRTSATDMTGTHIATTYPVAFLHPNHRLQFLLKQVMEAIYYNSWLQ